MKQSSGAIKLRSWALLDAPKTIWGSNDRSEKNYSICRHRGEGISRSDEYPSRSNCLPGGIIDSTGLHVPILGLDARELPPTGVPKIAVYLVSMVGTFEYKFSFGEPEQLTLDQYKSKMVELNKKEKGMPKTWRKIEKAENFYDAMMADIPKPIMEAYYGVAEVKNWIDEPKRYVG